MDKIKLVVWDLDETFWKGTLSEGEITIVKQNVEIVKELTRRGIINSISSKNDFEKAKSELVNAGVWDYFVFPSIDWAPKGQNVKGIIEDCQLRAPNVLFIDDNIGNLKEVEHYNPDINIADEGIIPKLLGMEELKGKDDSSLSRLKQYKILEQKVEAKATYTDNHAFLRDSDIHISFIEDVKQYKERILELINRTNQLNYTKVRLSEDELDAVLENKDYENICLKVTDRFGDYGICGFYSYNKSEKKLRHFLFSCRILNLGVPAYVFKKLNKPALDVVVPVAEELTLHNIDWIKENVQADDNTKNKKKEQEKKTKILLLGGCDLEQMCHYIDTSKFDIVKEFNYPNKSGIPVHREHTVYLRELDSLSEKEKNKIYNLPFGDENMLDSQIYEDNYDILVYSVLMNYTHEVYVNKETGFKVAYGGYMNQFELCRYLNLSEKDSSDFFKDYQFAGLQSPEDFIEDLKWIVNRVKKPVIFINGAETQGFEAEKESYSRHVCMNSTLQKYVDTCESDVKVLDVRQFIHGIKDHKDNIRHYQRPIYVNMAEELMSILTKENISVGKIVVLKDVIKFYQIKITNCLKALFKKCGL